MVFYRHQPPNLQNRDTTIRYRQLTPNATSIRLCEAVNIYRVRDNLNVRLAREKVLGRGCTASYIASGHPGHQPPHRTLVHTANRRGRIGVAGAVRVCNANRNSREPGCKQVQAYAEQHVGLNNGPLTRPQCLEQAPEALNRIIALEANDTPAQCFNFIVEVASIVSEVREVELVLGTVYFPVEVHNHGFGAGAVHSADDVEDAGCQSITTFLILLTLISEHFQLHKSAKKFILSNL